jgi:hypothetical protein
LNQRFRSASTSRQQCSTSSRQASRWASVLSDLVRTDLAASIHKKSEDAAAPRELVVQYVVGGYMAVLTWWLDGEAKLPPHRIDAMFRRLATESIM